MTTTTSSSVYTAYFNFKDNPYEGEILLLINQPGEPVMVMRYQSK